jgi:hypothetical protein
MNIYDNPDYDNWFVVNENSLMVQFLIGKDLMKHFISWLNEMPALSPRDFDDPDLTRRYINAKHEDDFNSYCLDKWESTR